jgi:N-acyl-D-amino-acid deacylase
MWVMRYLVRSLAALLTVVITPGAISISPGVPVSAQSPAGVSAAAQAGGYDVIIRNGRLLDGSGNPWVRGDVAIRGARIAAVGRLADAKATTIIDAGNRFVTPGFIDVHSHAAEGLSRTELRQARPIVAQGVTTIVVNPDGGGPVDLAAQRAALSKGGVGPNVALLIGHGSVRGAVMRTDPNRAPTSDELTQMKALVRAGMEQGAFGLSSGLFYTPGSYSKTDEVVALAAVAGEFGGVYTSHIRDEGDYNVGVVAAVQEVIRIAEEGRLTGIVSHMKALGPDNWGLSMASTQRIAQARARGIPVFADQYPYEASSTSLRAALLPGGVELPKSDANAAAVQPERDQRRKIEDLLRENIRRRGGAASIQIASYAPDRGLEGKRLDEIARDRKKTPEATAFDMLVLGNASIVSFNMSDADIRHIMIQPYTMASSDGGLSLPGASQPHPRNNGAFARRLAHYVRDEQVIGLEFAIRSMTSLPATVFGMKDRGVLREGAVADIAIFDLEAIRDRATYSDPHQIAEGMTWVFVNGVPIVRDAKFTEELPGVVLKK